VTIAPDDRLQKIVELLIDETSAGRITWAEQSPRRGVEIIFEYSSTRFGVAIQRLEDGMIVFVVKNDNGDEVGALNSGGADDPWSEGARGLDAQLETLLDLARRSARRVDETLDFIIEELDAPF